MGLAEVGPYLDWSLDAVEEIPEYDVHCLYCSRHGRYDY